MWQVLLAAAVAGSTGFATKHFLTQHRSNTEPQQPPALDNPDDNDNNNNVEDPDAVSESGSGNNSRARDGDGVFTFSSSESGSSLSRPKKKNRVRVGKAVQRSGSEVVSGGRRLPFCLKKRKTTKNSASKDNSLFGWGLGYGIMFMMSAGKAEINNLNKTMDEAAKVVQELKSELNRRKSSCDHQILDSARNFDMNSRKRSGRHDELMLKKTNTDLRNTDVKIWSPAANDGGECGSSTLTEEPEPQVLEMDQLEAELEFELQKLSGRTIDSPCLEQTRPKLDEFWFDQKTAMQNEGCHGTDDLKFDNSRFHGVSPFELNKKLSHLVIKQQEIQISELESELQLAQSNLHQKEAELRALKDCVKRLTELSLSTVSDDETQALADPKGTSDWDNTNVDLSQSNQLLG